MKYQTNQSKIAMSKRLATHLILAIAIFTTGAFAELHDPWYGAGLTWKYRGAHFTYQSAEYKCLGGWRLPYAEEVQVALTAGINRNRLWTRNGINVLVDSFNHTMACGVWALDHTPSQSHALTVQTGGYPLPPGQTAEWHKENKCHVLCVYDEYAYAQPEVEPITPPTNYYGYCSRYTPHGLSACMNHYPQCSWSTQSQSCFDRKNMQCDYYSYHGLKPCMNNYPRCNWSTQSQSCFIKSGMYCEYYSYHGLKPCMDNYPRCNWSTQSQSCYTN